jgi:hypothetical protein
MRKPLKKRRLRALVADHLPATTGLPVLTGYPIALRPR